MSLLSANWVSVVFAFEPAKHVFNTNDRLLLFLEGENLKSFRKGFKSFYFSLREDAKNKKIEWNFLVQWLTSKIGFNLFNTKEARKIGIDNRHKFGFAMYKPSRGRGNGVQLLIPTSNADKFYLWFKNYFTKKTREVNQSSLNLRELKKGNLLQISFGKKRFYLAKSVAHVSFSNNQTIAIQGTQVRKNNLINSEIYKLFIKYLKKNKGHLASFLATPSIFSSMSQLSWFPFFKLNTSNTKIILKNTKLIHGEISVNSDGFNLSMRHLLQKKFLKKDDKKMIDFQLDFITKSDKNALEIGSLKLDKSENHKMLHLTGIFNPQYLWAYLDKIPFLNLAKLLPLKRPSRLLKKIFASSIRGNVSIIIMRPLPGRLSFNLHDTDFIASIGLKKETQKKIKAKLEKFLKNSFKRYGFQLRKDNHDKQRLWELTWSERVKKQILPRKLYVFFHDDTLSIVSTKKSIGNFLDNQGDDVIEQNSDILSAGKQETSGLILFDVDQIYRFVSKSSLGLLFPQYVGYIKNIKSLIFHSFQKNDTIFSEFKVRLK